MQPDPTGPVGPGHPVYDQVRPLVDQLPAEVVAHLCALIDQAEAAPRLYAMPDPPADLTRVRDRNGDEWVRGADALDWVKPAGRTVERHWGWAALLSARGPLTEVTDDHA